MFSESTGYGRDGIGMARALVRRGYEVSLEATHVIPPLPQDVALLFTVEPNPPFDLYISHAPPAQFGVPVAYENSIYKSVAWTMWEFSDLAPGMHQDVINRMKSFDYVIVNDTDTLAVFEALGTDREFPVVQGGYEPNLWEVVPEYERDWDAETFVVGIAGELSGRKDPYVAMRAVQRLADEGHKIVLLAKCRYNEIPKMVMERYKAVTVFYGYWPSERMHQFYSSLHCYVAPSWGEGLNLPAVEAGTTGAALLVSDVGGHRAWALNGEVATLLPVERGRLDDAMWHAKVIEDDLVEALRKLVTDREYARQRGAVAAKTLPVMMSWDRALDRLMAAIQ
jgi:glycosyltransferase involved in cell wall biosynthesis